MSMHRVVASRIVPQLWRNGGGRTRELLCWPSSDDWSMRISLADIDVDGPFSAFPGVTRWFTVVDGAGVALSWGGEAHRLRLGAAPLRFDGGLAPDCRLIDGPTRDLNLMLCVGDGTMRVAERDAGWAEAFVVRGLYTESAGRWSAGEESLQVDASTLLWSDDVSPDATPWHFTPTSGDEHASAWWLGFTPAVAA